VKDQQTLEDLAGIVEAIVALPFTARSLRRLVSDTSEITPARASMLPRPFVRQERRLDMANGCGHS
jgi:hypothetical protein